MGTWGTGIFSSDISLDVKGDYLDALKAGRTDQEAEDYVAHLGADIPPCDEEYCAFWTALAMIQWKYGRLSDKVSEKAVQIIDNGGDCELFEKNDKIKREKELLKCKETILSPMPVRKTVKTEKPCRISPWAKGDVFGYRISTKNIQNEAFFNKYFVFIITDVKHDHRDFQELEFDEVSSVVLNKVYNEIPLWEDLKGIVYLRFHGTLSPYTKNVPYAENVIPLSWLNERSIKKFLAQTVFIGQMADIPSLRAKVYSMKTFLQNIENTLVEVYQDEKLNAR
ncbi:MAG: DUF4259 domain-containing protein [Defluviitaleaceae bacterium]|nr:DUF4259 domain-containing protein [Defluviitaleaceae bacterium]